MLPIQKCAIILNDTSISGHPGCVLVMENMRASLQKYHISIIASYPLGIDFASVPGSNQKIKSADLVIINGEGTLHHTATRPFARRLLNSIDRIKAIKPIPVFVVNATIEALAIEELETLSRADGIYVRESASLNYLASNGVKAKHAADLTLSVPFTLTPLARRGLFVTDSVLHVASDKLAEAASRLGGTYQKMKPSRLWVYPSYFLNPQTITNHKNQFTNKIASAEGVLTGRFHAMLFCMALDTPFLSVGSNTSKVQSILSDAFGNTARCIVDPDTVKSQKDIPTFTPNELRNLAAYLKSAAERIESMWQEISACH
jgi:polysaccharide pyruvyl transferase WcaK-like protein